MPLLVLSRRQLESIHIGPDITVTVRQIDPKVCRLAIVAPAGVKILRSELGRPKRENQEGGAA